MSAFVPEFIVIGVAITVVVPLALYILRESAKLDREQRR